MDNPLISVVMPVYNVEKYLSAAVESILQQTYRNLEIILIDDYSTDSSREICDDLAKKDERIQVILLEQNGGASNARNLGITLAKGDYILFMDSDDVLDLHTLQSAVDSLHQNPAKLVIWGLIEEYRDQQHNIAHTVTITYPNQRLNSKDELRKHVINLEEKTLLGYPWNKLYDLTYLKEKGYQFPHCVLNEDIMFNIKFIEEIDSMNILDIAPYHYQKKISEGLTSKFVVEYYDLHIQRVSEMLDLYKKWNMCTNEVKQILANIYARYIISAIQRNCDKRSGMSAKEQKKWIRDLFKTYLYQELMQHVCPNSKMMSKLSGYLKEQNVRMCYLSGKGIYFVKNKLPMVFAKAKQNR